MATWNLFCRFTPWYLHRLRLAPFRLSATVHFEHFSSGVPKLYGLLKKVASYLIASDEVGSFYAECVVGEHCPNRVSYVLGLVPLRHFSLQASANSSQS